MTVRHSLCTHRERQRDRREQTFRNQRDRDPDREQETAARGAADEQRQSEERCADAHRQQRDRADDPVELVREGGPRRLGAGGELGDPGQLRVRSDGLDDAVRRTRHDVGPGESVVPDPEVDRNALAVEGRRVDRDVIGRGERDVGRDAVPGRQDHDVADDHVGRLDGDRAAVATHDDARGEEILQAGGGALRPLFLDEGEHAVHDDHDDDRDRELGHSGDERQHGCDPEHQREEVGEIRDQPPPGVGCRWRWQSIRTVTFASCGGLGAGEARESRALDRHLATRFHRWMRGRQGPEQRRHVVIGTPNGIRTRVTALKGRRPRPLDDGGSCPWAEAR